VSREAAQRNAPPGPVATLGLAVTRVGISRSRGARSALVGAGVLCLALAGTALAELTIYKNPFSTKQRYKEVVRVAGGDACERAYSGKRDRMRITVLEGPGSCDYKPPVQGDGVRPDHRFFVEGRIGRKTDPDIRAQAYLAAAVRVGGGGRYELRIFPKLEEFELIRRPAGAGFPVQGMEAAIQGIRRVNVLRLQAYENQVTAAINGTQVADVTDGNAAELGGARLQFSLGTEADSGKNTVGTVEKLKLAIPDPSP